MWVALAIVIPAGLLVSVMAGDGTALVYFGSYASVGAYLAARRPSSPIGWLLLLTGFGLAMSSVVVQTPLAELTAGALDDIDALRAWMNASGWAVAFLGLVGLALTFPEGHLPPGRWRQIAQMTIGTSMVLVALICLHPTINVSAVAGPAGVDVANPYALAPGHPVWERIPSAGEALYPLFFLLVLVALTGLVSRARAATGIARLQYRWFVAGVAVVALALAVWAIATFILLLPANGLTLTLVVLLSPTIPLAVAIAVLRYRLFAIDRLISRTVSWALVTGGLVAVFGGLVIGLQILLPDVTQGETLAVAVSTLAAFAVFQPLRRRTQIAVDRRFDRARYDQQRTVDAFAGRIRDEVDLATLRHDLEATTEDAVRPAAASVWMRSGGLHR
jgi:hypothetical protein